MCCQDGAVVERVEEEEDPVLIFTAQKSAPQTDNILLITGVFKRQSHEVLVLLGIFR
jgi:hypothetical protein